MCTKQKSIPPVTQQTTYRRGGINAVEREEIEPIYILANIGGVSTRSMVDTGASRLLVSNMMTNQVDKDKIK